MHSHVTFALLLAATALQDTAAATFEWDCTKSMQTCNNACYAVNNRLAPGTLTYDADQTKREPRRKDSGCSRRPCKNSSLKYSQFGRSCDEFPFASTREGGAGAILRCVKNTDNSSPSTLPKLNLPSIHQLLLALTLIYRRGRPTE